MKRFFILLWVVLDLALFAAVMAAPLFKKDELPFEGQKVLVIGDSLTAAGQWQKELDKELGMEVTTRAKGGLGLIQMVDGDGAGFAPLSAADVKDQDLIILYGGYNNRGRLAGSVGDRYNPDGSGQTSFAGCMQYAIDRIRDTLDAAGNEDCEIMIVTMHCAGKYGWIDADAFAEYPIGSGQTMETLVDIQIAVAKANGLKYVDLFRTCPIGPGTWDIYSKDSKAVVTKYSPYLLDENGDPVSEERMIYVPGEWYYQTSSGKVMYKQYDGTTPHPYNGDQLHLNTRGYHLVGQTIVNRIRNVYGK